MVCHGRRGRQLLMDLVELAVHRGLALQVLTVQLVDQFMGRLPALVVGMVAIAKQELAARGGMLPDPPAAWLVTVVLLDHLVDARTDRAEDTELLQIRAEPGPESVVRAGFIDGAGVHLEPVVELRCVENPESYCRRSGAHEGGHGDQAPPHRCSPPAQTA